MGTDNSKMEQIETLPPREIDNPYVWARLNPPKDEFKDLLNKANHTILEVGCGNPPRLSWSLKNKELWVGCDPAIKDRTREISVHVGDIKVEPQSKLVVFSSALEDIDTFKPNVIICMAPNPENVVDGRIFNDSLSNFLNSEKKQYLIIGLDNRTYEALTHRIKAKEQILQWAWENKFVPIKPGPLIEERFDINSGDTTEADCNLMFFARNIKSSF